MPGPERTTTAAAVVPALVMTLVVAGCSTPTPRTAEAPPAATPPDILSIPDAVPRSEPRSKGGNPPFYEVFGKRYFVMNTAAGFRERGVASWYGPGFHAARTANGEHYDMYQMTAAHRTLPLPSYVRVTHLGNGRSVVVRVNDRGPFKDDRIIDLSYTAAAKLGMLESGTALVEVESVTPAGGGSTAHASPAPAHAAATPLYVQAGAFGIEDNAQRLLARLQSEGIAPAFVRRDRVQGRALYRVRVGPIPDVATYDRVVGRLRALGVDDPQLALDH